MSCDSSDKVIPLAASKEGSCRVGADVGARPVLVLEPCEFHCIWSVEAAVVTAVDFLRLIMFVVLSILPILFILFILVSFHAFVLYKEYYEDWTCWVWDYG